jgi:acylphosphatase
MIRARLLIRGRVQGVFYRASCREEAAARGLEGWVRNLPDGDVEALFQGPEDRVRDMIKWCYAGPPFARVSKIELTHEEPRDDLQGFRIR